MNLDSKIVAIIAITAITLLACFIGQDGDATTIALSGLLGFLAGNGIAKEKEST